MDVETDQSGLPATEEVAGGEVTEAACPDPVYCACARMCRTNCGGTTNTCYEQCMADCV